MSKDIMNKNSKGEYHGYQEMYWTKGNVWCRGEDKHNRNSGYREWYHLNDTIDSIAFYIL